MFGCLRRRLKGVRKLLYLLIENLIIPLNLTPFLFLQPRDFPRMLFFQSLPVLINPLILAHQSLVIILTPPPILLQLLSDRHSPFNLLLNGSILLIPIIELILQSIDLQVAASNLII